MAVLPHMAVLPTDIHCLDNCHIPHAWCACLPQRVERKTLARQCPTLLTLLKAFPTTMELQEPTFKDLVVVYRCCGTDIPVFLSICLSVCLTYCFVLLVLRQLSIAHPRVYADAHNSNMHRATLAASHTLHVLCCCAPRRTVPHDATQARPATTQAAERGCQRPQQDARRAHAGHPGIPQHHHQGACLTRARLWHSANRPSQPHPMCLCLFDTLAAAVLQHLLSCRV